MTTIIIVDDQNSIREFLKINLSAEVDMKVVGIADNGQSAVAQVEEHQPDIVLMDIEMPGQIDGIEATRLITERFPKIKVLLFTSQDDRQQLNRSLQAGARGYVLKNTSVKDISNIIRLTEKGFFQIGPILGNWDSPKVEVESQSDFKNTQTEYDSSEVTTIVHQDSKYANKLANRSEMNYVLSNLTSGIFQLQETIKSQEDTIINLTNQYSEVQQEIRTKLRKDQKVFGKSKAHNSNYRGLSKIANHRKQHIIFISSFFLGVLTVIVLMLVVRVVGGAA